MPLYEFQCRECDQPSELLIRSARDQAVCPSCGSSKMEKLLSVISAPVIQGSKSGACATPLPSMQGGCGKPQCGTGGCMFG